MSQNSLVINDASGAAVLAAINAALDSLASNNSGAGSPAITYPYMWWPDTTNGVLKQRNAANTGWIVRAALAETLVVARAANTALAAGDVGRCIIASGSWTQTFNAASTLGDGWFIEYRNNGTGVITLDPNASETIDGATTIQVAPGETCCIYCNGTAFYTVGRTAAAQQSQAATAFTSAGTAPTFTLTPVPALTAYSANQRFRVKFHATGTGADTLNVSGLGAKSLKQYDSTGTKVAAVITTSQLADVEYDGVDFVILDPLPPTITVKQIQSIAASVASNALTLTLNPTSLDFRANALNSSTVNTRSVPAAISLVVPSGATLGTVNGKSARLALLAIDNAGTVELAVVNLGGGVNLDETTLISSTAISAVATSSSTIYSTTARANVPFRVVGFIDITEAAAGTWATAPTKIQGEGGQVRISGTSMVRLNTANGYGSTNTKIRRLTNVVANQGTDITYADSATLGASFTINTPGVYAISYGDQGTSAMSVGLSLNTSVPTTNVQGIPAAEMLSMASSPAANGVAVATWTGFLNAGDVVRPHADGTATGINVNGVQFTITRVS